MAILLVDELTKRYRNGTLANDNLSLAVEPGEVYALLGPNGAGKTTLVRQVLGLLKPTSGRIHVDGVDVVADPKYARRAIGFLPQAQFAMEAIQVGELVYGIARLRGLDAGEARRRTDELLDELDLGPFRGTQLRSASGGIRRLAAFATAVVGHARFLVLDEPTNDVDPVRRQLLWSRLAAFRREGTTVLLVTHNLAEAERVIDRFAIIDHGRILREGTPAALRSLVTDRLRLEVTTTEAFGGAHPALQPDPATPGAYLFDHSDLAAVSAWVQAAHESGELVDFRIGPPTLDDIYTVTVGDPRREAVGAAK
ncbi:MAG: ABC transporter ATP-binding protein [Dehalococcoidia bacterium]|nr:ABC transporter ATP-binding protein [Dehalococcoidia bacterium]